MNNKIFQTTYWLLGWFYDFTKGIAVVILVFSLINIFGFTFDIVEGNSMQPALTDGDVLMVDRLTYYLRLPQKDEIAAIKPSIISPETKIVKRIRGVPGEKFEFRGKPEILRWNEYFVEGDNLPESFDSRRFGPIKINEFDGRVLLKVWHIY